MPWPAMLSVPAAAVFAVFLLLLQQQQPLSLSTELLPTTALTPSNDQAIDQDPQNDGQQVEQQACEGVVSIGGAVVWVFFLTFAVPLLWSDRRSTFWHSTDPISRSFPPPRRLSASLYFVQLDSFTTSLSHSTHHQLPQRSPQKGRRKANHTLRNALSGHQERHQSCNASYVALHRIVHASWYCIDASKEIVSDAEESDDDMLDEIPAKEPKAAPVQEEEDDEDDDDSIGEDEFQVEKILDHKTHKGSILYRIKWLGYEDETDETWEPEENL